MADMTEKGPYPPCVNCRGSERHTIESHGFCTHGYAYGRCPYTNPQPDPRIVGVCATAVAKRRDAS